MDRDLLESLYHRVVAAAQPAEAIAASLPPVPRGRTVVIGAGKASAQMAQAFERAWPGQIDDSLVVTRYGYAAACERIEIVEAAHPVPDMAGFLAARRMLEKVHGLGRDDLVVALISGGGSALLPQPAPGLEFEDEQKVNEALLASGAPIGVMNLIRNQLSTIKGGRLAAAAAPATVATLIVSDIPGDDPALVASGPTVPMAGTRAEARHLAALYRLQLPEAAERLLASEDNIPPVPGAPFAGNSVEIIASAAISLEAAAETARQAGLDAHILSDAVEGEARDVALVHAAVAKEIAARNRPFPKPALLLSGGETTVTLRGKGRGGRNAEFLLAFAIAIDGVSGISALAADTDGIDGAGDNAGAYADGTTAQRLRAAGIDPRHALANNDAYNAFNAIGDLFVTGPTGTNVNDFRAIIIR